MKHDLSTCAYGDVRGVKYQLAILPWGATEPHNLHLPYMTDCILSHDVAVEAARMAYLEYGVRCMVMPPIGLGSQNPGQRELPFCVHSRYETQKAVLTDIVASLYSQGIRRMVIVNGHGGNCFKNMIRDLSLDYPDFLIASGEWYTIIPAKEYFDDPGDHADELETSVMMHFHPELVDLSKAGPGESTPFAIDSLNKKVAWLPRHWDKATKDTGVGDPRRATAEKGGRYVQALLPKLAKLFFEFSTKSLY